jgi:phage tail sheath protein FI
MIPAAYTFSDNASYPWFAPAGTTRGRMSYVTRVERNLTQTNRDNLYVGNVNPLATFPQQGVVIFGQKTLQKQPNALDRVNVRRLLIELINNIGAIANTLVFEQNTQSTRNDFLSQVNPYLSSVQQREGVYEFKVVMDESNNTPQTIDNNQLIGQIWIKPTRTAEFISLDFNILPSSATIG